MIRIDVNVKDGVSPALAKLIDLLEDASDLNEQGGRAASEAAKDWQADFSDAGGWRGKNYLGIGANTPGEFGQNISLGWNFQEADNDGATITNNADFYAFKVTGGTIIPKRTDKLTIPMIEEAVGRRVKDYIAYSGNVLFKILGKKALFEAVPGGVRAVYALAESVTQKPMPQAVPDEDVLAEAFIEAWRNGFADSLEEL